MPEAGYFWTSEVTGYIIRYAYRDTLPGGGSRITLLTERRLGGSGGSWRLAPPVTPNNYQFTLIELRLPAKGAGEGKASLSGTVRVDPETKGMALENYAALPVVLRGVTGQAP
jgi:hypothetical protein